MQGINNLESTNDSGWVVVVANKLFYRKIGAIVYVKVLTVATTEWTTIGTLPEEVRPSNTLYFSNSNAYKANLAVASTGAVQTYADYSQWAQFSYCLG